MKLFPKSKLGKIRLLILLSIVIYLLFPFLYWYISYHPQEGDILFQSLLKTELVKLIEGISDSSYSHCGVVVNRNGKWYVNEAIGSVHDTSLFLWTIRGRGHRFAVYRLRDEFKKYIPSFIKTLEKYQGKPYDFKYDLDDDYIYCSELIFKAFKDATNIELGKLVRFGDLNWQPYKETIIKYEGGDPPLDRLIITPKHLSEAEQLTKVVTHY